METLKRLQGSHYNIEQRNHAFRDLKKILTDMELEKEKYVTLLEIEQFLLQEGCPLKEEESGAFEGIKGAPGDNHSFADLLAQESYGSSSFNSSLLREAGKVPSMLLPHHLEIFGLILTIMRKRQT